MMILLAMLHVLLLFPSSFVVVSLLLPPSLTPVTMWMLRMVLETDSFRTLEQTIVALGVGLREVIANGVHV